jgi:flagellar motor switch/type III secretory pathway protein FliN
MVTTLALPKQIPIPVTDEVWSDAAWLTCLISVDLSLVRFTVRDLLRLDVGAILETKNAEGADVPVMVNAQLIGWGEFELVGRHVAVRMTEVG